MPRVRHPSRPASHLLLPVVRVIWILACCFNDHGDPAFDIWVVGQITLSTSGAPVDSASISVLGSYSMVTSDSLGRFELFHGGFGGCPPDVPIFAWAARTDTVEGVVPCYESGRDRPDGEPDEWNAQLTQLPPL